MSSESVFSKFTDSEKKTIASSAIALARLGEIAILDIACLRIRLQARLYLREDQNLTVEIGPNSFVLTPNEIKNQVEIFGETIRQARAILQFTGSDDASVIEHYKNSKDKLQSS